MSTQGFDPVGDAGPAFGGDVTDGAGAGGGGAADAGRGGTAGPVGGDGPDEVAAYAAAVRAELSDLSVDDSADLLEDLEDHLREVAAEGADAKGALRERLGEPAAYAAELRDSAGLPPKGTTGPDSAAGRLRRDPRRALADRVGAVEDRIRGNRFGAEVLAFVPTLRPAWWVLRAWIVLRLVEVLTNGGGNSQGLELVGRVGDSRVLALVLLLGAVVGSVWFAKRQPGHGWRRSVLAVAQTLLVLFAIGSYIKAEPDGPGGGPVAWASQDASGLRENGRPISNLAVYDKDGKLLTGVYVYDQDGNQVVTGTFDGSGFAGGGTQYSTPTWLDKNGFVIGNLYPLENMVDVWNGAGAPRRVPMPGPVDRRQVPAPVTHLAGGLADCTFVFQQAGGSNEAVCQDSPTAAPSTPTAPSMPTAPATTPGAATPPTSAPATPAPQPTPAPTTSTP